MRGLDRDQRVHYHRRAGRLAAAEVALHSMATVEAPLYPGQEVDAAGIDGSPGVEIGHERARPLVEFRGLAHE